MGLKWDFTHVYPFVSADPPPTKQPLTWITRMFSPVSCASCSRMCRVGFGVATNAAFNVSSCLALMVVRGPRLLVPEFCSSFSILFVSLSDDVELSVSFTSSCIGSCRSGDKLLSVHDDTENKQEEGHDPKCQAGRGAVIRPVCSEPGRLHRTP